MNPSEAKHILRLLADGIDPVTGEVFPADSPYQNPQVIRALFAALRAVDGVQGGSGESPAPRRAGEKWTQQEDTSLRKRFENGKTVAELAKLHKRTEGAIGSRLAKLGLLQPAPEPKRAISSSADPAFARRINRDLDDWTGGGEPDEDNWNDMIDFLDKD